MSIWRTLKLDQLGSVGRGRSKHRPRNDPQLYGGPYPFFQTGDVTQAELCLRRFSQTYSDSGLAQSKLWQSGTLCITIAANIADTAILAVEGCFPDSIVGFIADPNKADVRFIKYYIDTIKRSMQNVSKGTTQDNLSLDKLLMFDFRVPSVDYQRRIASILSAYDDLIENNTRRIAIFEEMARRLYEEWFLHFRFPGHEQVRMVQSELGLIPEGWMVSHLFDFGKVVTGKTPSKANPAFFGNDVPFIKTPDMHDNMFCISTSESLSELGAQSQENKTLPPNSLCVSCIGTAGVVTITSQAAQTNQQINSIVISDIKVREFLYFALHGLKETIQQYGANGATMVNLNKSKFENLKVIFPDKSILVQFHEMVVAIFDLVKILQYKNTNLRAQRDLLLPKLISGEIDVSSFPDPKAALA